MRPLRIVARCRRLAYGTHSFAGVANSSLRASAYAAAPASALFSSTAAQSAATASDSPDAPETAASRSEVAAQSFDTLLSNRKASADAGAKMLQFKSLPATAPVVDALETMKKNGISMVLVTKEDDPATVVGYFSEKGFKNGIKHEAHVPAGLTVGEMARSDLFTVTSDTPVVGAIHDLIHTGARHALLLRDAGEDDDDDDEHTDASATDQVVRKDSVSTGQIAAVVSIRDMIGHAISVHFKALQRAEAAMEQVRIAKETGTDPPEEAVAAVAEWESLSEVEAKMDTEAYGAVVKDAEDVLETLSRLGKRTAYINCLDDAKIDTAAAVNLLRQEEVAALLVVSKESQINGIFTMRDFIWKIAGPPPTPSSSEAAAEKDSDAQRDASQTKVTDVMTTDVRVGRINWPVEKCARVMLRHSIRHLPLASKGDGDFMGLVSLADVTRFTVKARFDPAPEDEAKDKELRKQAVEYFEDLARYGRA